MGIGLSWYVYEDSDIIMQFCVWMIIYIIVRQETEFHILLTFQRSE